MKYLFNKEVLTDLLSFYKTFTHLIYNREEECKDELSTINMLIYNGLLVCSESDLILRSKLLFKQLSELYKWLDDYGKPWDIYLGKKDSRYIFTVLVELEDFNLIDTKNNVKDFYPIYEPYLTLTFEFSWEKGLVGYYDGLGLIRTKITHIEYNSNFVHPHNCSQFNFSAKHDYQYYGYGDVLSRNNMCKGNSLLSIDFSNILSSQEEFNYFMYRFESYIKEYNSSDTLQSIPTTNEVKYIDKNLKLGINGTITDYSLKSLSNILLLDENYYFIHNNNLVITDLFFEDIKRMILDEKMFSNYINLNMIYNTNGKSVSYYEMSLSNNTENISQIDEWNQNLIDYPLIFRDKVIHISVIKPKAKVTLGANEYYFTNNFKIYITNEITKYINAKY